MKEKVRPFLDRMDDKGALTREDQLALAEKLGIDVRQLPLSMRGGLLGIFGLKEEDRNEGRDSRP